MADSYFTDQTFKDIKSIEKGDYENCQFINCNLPNSDLSGIRFIECELENCDFSSTKLYDASFNHIVFKNSKLLGMRFEDCNQLLFSVEFAGCNLNLSSFYQMAPKNILFRNCNLKEVDFTGANLTEAIFDSCNLDQAIFNDTTLEKTDFRTSYNFLIDPETSSIIGAKFSLQGLPGLLHKYDLDIE